MQKVVLILVSESEQCVDIDDQVVIPGANQFGRPIEASRSVLKKAGKDTSWNVIWET